MVCALLNASFETDATSRNFRRKLASTVVEFDVTEGEHPDGYAFDGAVITGSGASVYWEEPWIDRLLAWTQEAFERDVPLLGVCFGAQVLAETLGGRVEGQDTRELGYHTIHHSDDSPLFAGVDREFCSFVSHGDDIVDLPLGACKLAENEHALHAFGLDNAFGVLFHPEYDFETAERIFEKRSDEPLRGDPDGTVTREHYEAARESARVFGNFEAYARLHR